MIQCIYAEKKLSSDYVCVSIAEYNPIEAPMLNEKVLRDKRKKLRDTFDRVFKLYVSMTLVWSGDVAQLVEHQTSTLLRQVRFPGAARDFSPRVNFQCRLCYGVCTPPCATTCINICARVKDPVVHVRVW